VIISIVLVATMTLSEPTRTGHPIWEADVSTTESAPAYIMKLDGALSAVAGSTSVNYIDVIDWNGRAMPRNIWPRAYRLHKSASHDSFPGQVVIWFENIGTPPYHLRVGAKSSRVALDYPTPSAAQLVGDSQPESVIPPIATLTNVRLTGTYVEPPPTLAPAIVRGQQDGRKAWIVALVAAAFVGLFISIDIALRRRFRRRKTPTST